MQVMYWQTPTNPGPTDTDGSTSDDDHDADHKDESDGEEVYAMEVVHSEVKVRLDLARQPITIIYDTGCGMALVDHNIVAQEIRDVEIKKLPKGIAPR
ncbi:uncharacterized protein N7496_003101 [Penicillium cataractarum]|uniref:Uncharacterized protein n=1 Tax=Penicillium cataractarum TaxID=2100454 RepID=A0A9W9SLD2_9EURO|nr:uncharacterized protein N7496_003101 [Penicillium cataractarum]KAJ5380673.1 hypothetical protein N7496_003101 [Penicillium cataractarum]